MSHPFGAQNTLTGFAFQLSDLLWLNEVSRSDPYHLYHAGTSASGFSFGALQWDIPNHAPFAQGVQQADEIFRDILLNARDANDQPFFDQSTVDLIVKIEKDANGNVISRTGLAYTKGNSHALDAYLAGINNALDSDYGRAQIDASHINEINAISTWVNDTVALVTNPADNAFLASSDVARLFIGDFRNQFGNVNNNRLRSFLQGQTAFGITKQGTLGVDDLLNFYFRTPHASQFTHDPVRRFANVVEVAGGYTPPDVDEAKGVLQAYTFFVVPNRGKISAANSEALTEFMVRFGVRSCNPT